MHARLDWYKVAPGAYKAMAGGLEPGLLELVRVRASQINGCAYCLDMHGKDARAPGESEQRLYAPPPGGRRRSIAIGFRMVPGTYQPAGARKSGA